LNENRLAYTKIGYLKPEKFEEIKKQNQEFTFKPKIPTTSEVLEKAHTERFLINHPIEEKRPQTQRDNASDNINKLLFEFKDIEKSLTGRGDISQHQETHEVNETARTVNRSKSSNKVDRVDLLMKKDEVKQKKIEDKKKVQEIENLKECTFHPQTIAYRSKHTTSNPAHLTERLYNQHQVKQKREEDRQMELIEKQTRELEACTFKPEINPTSSHTTEPYQSVLMPRGYDKTVGRIRYAVDENKKKERST